MSGSTNKTTSPFWINDVSSLTDEELRQIRVSLRGRVRSLSEQTEVVTSGERAADIHIVKSGWLASYKELEDGRRQVFRFWVKGDVVGVIYAFSDALGLDDEGVEEELLSMSACTTLTPVVLETIEAAQVRQFVDSHPHLALKFFTEQVRKHANLLTRHLTGAGRQTAREGIAALILELASREGLSPDGVEDMLVTIPLNQQELADSLGMTAEHLSRVLGNFESEGLIERIRKAPAAIVVRNFKGLVETAGGQPYDNWPIAEESA